MVRSSSRAPSTCSNSITALLTAERVKPSARPLQRSCPCATTLRTHSWPQVCPFDCIHSGCKLHQYYSIASQSFKTHLFVQQRLKRQRSQPRDDNASISEVRRPGTGKFRLAGQQAQLLVRPLPRSADTWASVRCASLMRTAWLRRWVSDLTLTRHGDHLLRAGGRP